MHHFKRQHSCQQSTNIHFIITLLLLIFASNGISQTASEYFQKGVNAASLNEKIQAFERATQLDPNYVEAFFYLGLAYKSNQQYQQAEITLNKAYYTNPYALNDKIKAQILFELGTVYMLTGKTKKGIETFRGVEQLAGRNNSLRGRTAYELGQAYIAQGEYTTALEILRRGKRLLPQNSVLFNEAITKANGKQGLNSQYANANSLLQAGRHTEAITLLERIAKADPNFKDVLTLLETARLQSAQRVQPLQIDSQVQPQSKPERKVSPPKIDSAQNQPVAKQRVRQKTVVQTEPETPVIEQHYKNGVAALRKKQWQQALEQFDAVQRLEPGYGNVANLLAQAQRELRAAREKKAKTAQLYKQGKTLMENKEWRQAAAVFSSLQAIDPSYEDTEEQLLKIRDALVKQRQIKTNIDTLYQHGVTALQTSDWLQAVLAFEKVKMLNPAYKDVENKLADARFNLKRNGNMAAKTDAKNTGALLWIGSGVSLLLLPMVGAFAFSPTLRARVYLSQGHYLKAARIYENFLKKKPERVALYPILANIYLLEDQRDENAIRVFETTLKLNVLTQRRAEINSIVSDYYLSQGRTDGNAIAIMERELDKKLKKLSSGTI